ncbi:hypothetical protein PQI23_05390 [Leucobacter sp. USCH14]|uniref:hypothetical protein n=1 Tax=Leucobacter sp. USCH14 TaxID=3024838 RepID=UPI0030B00EEE
MSGAPELLRQGAQRRGTTCSIGFITTKLRASDAGGGIAARLGISSPDGRTAVELGPGETAPLPGGGTVHVVDIFVSPDGTQTAAAIEITEAEPTSTEAGA